MSVHSSVTPKLPVEGRPTLEDLSGTLSRQVGSQSLHLDAAAGKGQRNLVR